MFVSLFSFFPQDVLPSYRRLSDSQKRIVRAVLQDWLVWLVGWLVVCLDVCLVGWFELKGRKRFMLFYIFCVC